MRTDEQMNRSIDILFERLERVEAALALKDAALQQLSGRNEVVFEPAPAEQQAAPSGNAIESAIGTRWIGRIGILAILFGIAFFLKYSFDNKLIGETGRVILGIFWGVAFIGAGEFFQSRKGWTHYAQALSGGGLAILYLSFYAAFAMYHLMPGSLATIGLIAVTTTGMTLSVRYSAFALAAIALLGGFLTPFMLSTGENRPVQLFSYILLLDLGAVFLLRFRPWRSLALASLFGTVLVYIAWHGEYFTAGQSWIAFGICATFFLLYSATAFLLERITRISAGRIEQAMIFSSAVFFAVAIIAQQSGFNSWTARFMVAGLAAVELFPAWQSRRSGDGPSVLTYSFTGASLLLTVIATCMTASARWLAPALAVEAAFFCWMGLAFRSGGMRIPFVVTGIVSLLALMDGFTCNLEPFRHFIPIINSRFLSVAIVITACYAILRMLSIHNDSLDRNDRVTQMSVFLITQILSVLLLSTECLDYFRYSEGYQHLNFTSHRHSLQLSLSVLWAIYGASLTGVGIAWRIRPARILGIAMLALTILKVFIVDMSGLNTVYRIASFIVLGLLLLAVSYFYNRFKNLLFGDEQP